MKTKNENENTYNPEITKVDLSIIGNKNENLRSDEGADSHLKRRPNAVDFEGKDLDIPGRGNERKINTLKDEENRHHSLGSSDNESLETNAEVDKSLL